MRVHRERVHALAHQGGSDVSKVAAHHRRLSNRIRRGARCFRDSLDEDTFERSLTQFARNESHDEVLLRRSSAAEKIFQQIQSRVSHSGATHIRKPREHRVDVEQLERSLVSGDRVARPSDYGPSDSDAPLKQPSRQKRNGNPHFVRGKAFQQLRQPACLLQSRAGAGNRIGYGDQLVETHLSMLQKTRNGRPHVGPGRSERRLPRPWNGRVWHRTSARQLELRGWSSARRTPRRTLSRDGRPIRRLSIVYF